MLDGLVASVEILTQLGLLLFDPLISESLGGPPSSRASVTPAWLSVGLQTEAPGGRVDAVTILDQHAGTTDRARLALRWAECGSGTAPPTSLFIKLHPPDLKRRLFVNLLGLGATEVRFYQELAAQAPLQTPRVYHAVEDGRSRRFVLLLEDLTERGARFPDILAPATPQQAQTVAGELARLHAAFWDSPRFAADLRWLKSPEHNPYRRIERLLWGLIKRGQRRLANELPATLLAAADRLVAAYDGLTAAWTQGPRTLLHGDTHLGNLFFVGESVGFLDWQCAQHGQGTRDLTYFLCTSLTTETRRRYERDILAYYLEVLRAAGVAEPPSLDQVQQQHRWGALYAWIAMAITSAAADLQTAPVVEEALRRSAAAVTDLESLGLLAGR